MTDKPKLKKITTRLRSVDFEKLREDRAETGQEILHGHILGEHDTFEHPHCPSCKLMRATR